VTLRSSIKNIGRVLLAALFILMGMVLFTPLGGNLWFLLREELYLIPESSTVFTFRPTALNPGPGDWWIYGEDSRRFYHFGGEPGSLRSVLRTESGVIEGFDPLDADTWP
jgi:hypothetical protein